jgi:translation initiation factor 5B
VIENYLEWSKKQREAEVEQKLETLVRPAKIQVLQGYVFRRAKPAIFGVEILAGRIKPRVSLMRAEDGEDVGEIQQIQEKGEPLPEAEKGMQVAVSMEKPIVGRHVFEKDILYTKVPEEHAKALLTTFLDQLTADEQETLKEYVDTMRKKMPFWAA